MRSFRRLLLAGVLAAGAATVPVVPSASAAAALTLAPSDQVMTITANAEEVYKYNDRGDDHDRANFARRVYNVLTARLNSGGAVYIPDLIFLQEVNQETGTRIAQLLSIQFGVTYSFAVAPAAGENAYIDGETNPLVERDTGVLYNTSTMSVVGDSHAAYFGVDKSDWTKDPDLWTTRASSLSQVTKGGRNYVVASVHFLDSGKVTPSVQLQKLAGWIDWLKYKISYYWGNTPAIVGGDTNGLLCTDSSATFHTPGCNANGGESPMGTAVDDNPKWKSALGVRIDHIFTTKTFVADDVRKDESYRSTSTSPSDYVNIGDYNGRFQTGPNFTNLDDAFAYCDAHYLAGDESTYTDAVHTTPPIVEIPGCERRYYSDHPFDWALVQG